MAKRGRIKGRRTVTETFERQQKLETITRLMLMGWTHDRIAKEVGCSRPMVTRDVGIIKKKWEQSQVQNMTAIKNQHLAELDHLKTQFYEGWQRSIGTQEAKSIKRKATGEEDKALRTQDSPGDPRFLNGVLSVLGDKADVQGIAPPKQINLNDISKRPVEELLGRLVSRLPSAAAILGAATQGD